MSAQTEAVCSSPMSGDDIELPSTKNIENNKEIIHESSNDEIRAEAKQEETTSVKSKIDDVLLTAKNMMKNNLDNEAADLLSDTLIKISQPNNGIDISSIVTAELYFQYGNALLLISKQNDNIFGDAVQTIKKDEIVEDDNDNSNDMDNNGNNKNDVNVDTDGKECDTNDIHNTVEAPVESSMDQMEVDDVSDQERAWESLEVARTLLEDCPKNDVASLTLLAKVYSTLGELQMETEQFESSIKDYQSAIDIEIKLQLSERSVAYLHFMLALSATMLTDISCAREHFHEALNLLIKRCETLMDSPININNNEENNEAEKSNCRRSDVVCSIIDKFIESHNGDNKNIDINNELSDLKEFLCEIDNKIEESDTLNAQELLSAMENDVNENEENENDLNSSNNGVTTIGFGTNNKSINNNDEPIANLGSFGANSDKRKDDNPRKRSSSEVGLTTPDEEPKKRKISVEATNE